MKNGNLSTANHQLQTLVRSQQRMIDELRQSQQSLHKQLNDRDNHWRSSLQNSLNKKDMRINELFTENHQLKQENKAEQMKNVQLKQQLIRCKQQLSNISLSDLQATQRLKLLENLSQTHSRRSWLQKVSN